MPVKNSMGLGLLETDGCALGKYALGYMAGLYMRVPVVTGAEQICFYHRCKSRKFRRKCFCNLIIPGSCSKVKSKKTMQIYIRVIRDCSNLIRKYY